MDRFPWDAAAHAGVVAARALNLRQDLVLRRAIDAAYLTESPLPAEPKDLLKVLRLPSAWCAEVEAAMSARFVRHLDGWVHPDANKKARVKKANGHKVRPIIFDATHIQWSGISDTQAEAWRAAYPKLDIDRELASAAAWAAVNPAKQDWGRFLARWLARAYDNSAKGGKR